MRQKNQHYLLHEDAVITLSSHSSMCQPNERTKTITGQITLAATSLPCNTRGLLDGPRCQRLDGTAHSNNISMVRPIGWLVTPAAFHIIQSKAQSIGPCQKWQQCPLLQLISEDWSVRATVWPNGEPRGSISQSNCQRGFCNAN